MKLSPATIYSLAALVSLVCIGIAVYYMVVGPYKVLVFDDFHGQHIKHTLVFAGLAILSPIAARFIANAQITSAAK